MRKRNPDAAYFAAPGRSDDGTMCACNVCPYMRLNTLEKIYLALRDLQPRIEMPEEIRLAALRPLERMMALG